MMRRLRQGSCRFIPAIALTACVAPNDVAAALSAGYQKHLEKPVNASALIRAARELALAPRSKAAPPEEQASIGVAPESVSERQAT
jgi:CheY-like chemotaxis protein